MNVHVLPIAPTLLCNCMNQGIRLQVHTIVVRSMLVVFLIINIKSGNKTESHQTLMCVHDKAEFMHALLTYRMLWHVHYNASVRPKHVLIVYKELPCRPRGQFGTKQLHYKSYEVDIVHMHTSEIKYIAMMYNKFNDLSMGLDIPIFFMYFNASCVKTIEKHLSSKI